MALEGVAGPTRDKGGVGGVVLHDTRGLHFFTFWRLRALTPRKRQNVNQKDG